MAQGLMSFSQGRRGNAPSRPRDIKGNNIVGGLMKFGKDNPWEAGLAAASLAPVPGLSDVAGFAGDVMGMVKRPEDRTWTNAWLAAAGLVPGIPALSALTFAGRGARTADIPQLVRAQKMETARAPRDKIWQETGWGRGADGEWRFEIDDSKAIVDPSGASVRAAKSQKVIAEEMYEPLLAARMAQNESIPIADAVKAIEKKRGMKFTDTQRVSADRNPWALQEMQNKADTAWPGDFNVFRADESKVVDHPGLLAAHEDAKDVMIRRVDSDKMGGAKGSYQEDVKEIRLDKDLNYGGDPNWSETSTGMHEIQHYLQGRNNFARGGNLSSRGNIVEAAQAEKKGLELAIPFAKSTREEMAAGEAAGTFQRLDKLSKTDRITPRDVMGLSTWYQYSHKVTAALGPMPKRSGPDQKKWLRSAAGELRDHVDGEIPSPLKFLTGLSAKDLKDERKQLLTRGAKGLEGERKVNKADNLIKRVRGQSDFETYQQIAGEVEARNVQKRLNYSADKRREVPPWDTEDVPREMQISMGRKGLLNF